jgi:hypothetical protein
MNYQFITPENINSLVGKTIKWNAPADRVNAPYTGIFKVSNVDMSQRRPIAGENIEGDSLEYAFVDQIGKLTEICYSDSWRYVSFVIVN